MFASSQSRSSAAEMTSTCSYASLMTLLSAQRRLMHRGAGGQVGQVAPVRTDHQSRQGQADQRGPEHARARCRAAAGRGGRRRAGRPAVPGCRRPARTARWTGRRTWPGSSRPASRRRSARPVPNSAPRPPCRRPSRCSSAAIRARQLASEPCPVRRQAQPLTRVGLVRHGDHGPRLPVRQGLLAGRAAGRLAGVGGVDTDRRDLRVDPAGRVGRLRGRGSVGGRQRGGFRAPTARTPTVPARRTPTAPWTAPRWRRRRSAHWTCPAPPPAPRRSGTSPASSTVWRCCLHPAAPTARWSGCGPRRPT